MILPKECRSLGDTHAINEEHLKENDMLLFVRRRSANAPDSDRDLDLKAPTGTDILEATKELPVPPPIAPKSASTSGSGRPSHNYHVTDDSTVETSVDVRCVIY